MIAVFIRLMFLLVSDFIFYLHSCQVYPKVANSCHTSNPIGTSQHSFIITHLYLGLSYPKTSTIEL